MKKLVLIGAGNRGMIYAKFAKESGRALLAAVVEPHEGRRLSAAKLLDIPKEYCFSDVKEMYAKGKIADAVMISSMDQDHFGHIMPALDLRYDILLEKPISPSPEECVKIQKKAKEKGCRVVVCHVLRYTKFFSAIKRILEEGRLGKIITIQHNENIGNYHIAHSFVRGNWRRSDLSSPLIMQKSCHDMDILTWFADSEAKRISSFGNLRYFKEENAPKGSTARCVDCPVTTCRFHAEKVYLPLAGLWPANVLTLDQSEEGLKKAVKEGPYGRCVYRCDNDVCDNQVTLIEFKNGVTVSFNLSGFTNQVSRSLKIMCENGEIRGDDLKNAIEVTYFSSQPFEECEQRLIFPGKVGGGHGGGDTGIMIDFLDMLEHGGELKSSIERSVESHIMAYAAERARITGKTVDIDELKAELQASDLDE